MFKSLSILLVLTGSLLSYGQNDLKVLVYSGTYQGYNVFVQNPFDKDGLGFSVKQVEIGGAEVTEQVFSSAFELELDQYNFELGDSVSIHLHYNSILEPKVINPGTLTPTNAKFKTQVKNLKVDDDTLLTWCFENEVEKSDFIIEQYRWNKWIKLGEVRSKGTSEKSCYEFVVDVHSGENQYRIVQYSTNNSKLFSKTVKSKNSTPPNQIIGGCKGGGLSFLRPTLYEIYDTYGNRIRKGYSDCPSFCGLEKGLYYVNYDNTTGDVFNIKVKISCEDKEP